MYKDKHSILRKLLIETLPQPYAHLHRLDIQSDALFWGSHAIFAAPNQLPFAASTLPCVLIDDPSRYTTSIESCLQELHRVIIGGGYLAILTSLVSEVPRLARYCNLFEKLRDSRHQDAYSLQDWRFFLEMAGFTIENEEVAGQDLFVGQWAANCDTMTLERLRVMLLQAPPSVREWYQIQAEPGLSPYADIAFVIPTALIIAQKP